MLRVNLTSSFAVLRAAAKAMMRPANGGGSIIFCFSAVARHGIPNHEAIAAAKGGVAALALSAAATYAPKGIRVNCVAWGLTRTPLAHKITSARLRVEWRENRMRPPSRALRTQARLQTWGLDCSHTPSHPATCA